MIPSDLRLFSWIDVEDVLLRRQKSSEWPSPLVWARIYWDGLKLGVKPGFEREVLMWIEEAFSPRFDSEKRAIILESLQTDNPRLLKIRIEPEEDTDFHSRFVPSLARPRVVGPNAERTLPEELHEDLPAVVSFHSFKGGVGRTIHAVGLAVALSEANKRVLLVDADLEAPGITWLVEKRWPLFPISFADLLALAHDDPNENLQRTIKLAANRLQGSLLDNIFVLPAFRTPEQFASLEIRPEHLVKTGENPFILTNMLASLGKELGVHTVIVDLRAGLSELATGLILDQRVNRVFVTTLSGQSLEGTRKLLELVREKSSPTREMDPLPALIVTQMPPEDQLTWNSLAELVRLIYIADSFLDNRSEDDTATQNIERIESPFESSLLALSKDWDDVVSTLRRSGLIKLMQPLIDWIGGKPEAGVDLSEQDLREMRISLRDLTKRFEYAETAAPNEFLAIRPLRSLAADNRNKMPVAVIVGAKGSGKTFTFFQMLRNSNWKTFCNRTGIQSVIDADFYPFLASLNIPSEAGRMISDTKELLARKYGFEKPLNMTDIKDHIKDGLRESRSQSDWRQFWLDLMAWAIGHKPNQSGAGNSLLKYLSGKNSSLIIIMDGLEELFLNVSGDASERTALRALLQDVPEWLNQQPGMSMGLLAFLRRDLITYSIEQNAGQFLALYEPYALKWDKVEALRLVAWTANKAGMKLDLESEEIQSMSEDTLATALVNLWGIKLGSNKSKEARTAEWVLGVLSDYLGQIQARDVIRFLMAASNLSISDEYWKDRILVPNGIRKATAECSKEKVKEIEQENKLLEEVFAALKSMPDEKKQIPFAREDANLSPQDIKILEQHGALLRIDEDYYIPEIYRFGLGFNLKYGKRPKVISLQRREAASRI